MILNLYHVTVTHQFVASVYTGDLALPNITVVGRVGTINFGIRLMSDLEF